MNRHGIKKDLPGWPAWGITYCSDGYSEESRRIPVALDFILGYNSAGLCWRFIGCAARTVHPDRALRNRKNAAANQNATVLRLRLLVWSALAVHRLRLSVHPEPTRWRFQWSVGFPQDGQLLVRVTHPHSCFQNSKYKVRVLTIRSFSGPVKLKPKAKNYVTSRSRIKTLWDSGPSKAIRQYGSVICRSRVGIQSVCSKAVEKGRGAVEGRITFIKNGKEIDATTCVVKETGHFQNFEWVHSGHVLIDEVG